MMGILLNAVFSLLISSGIIFAIFVFIGNLKDKKKAVPIYKLSYSGEYSQKSFWTKEILLLIILIQGFSFIKLWLPVNILMVLLIAILTLLYFSQLSRGVLGENGIVSATKFYSWNQIDSVEWITGMQADNPGYPSWGLVRFHIGNRTVEFIIKKKIEDEARSFIERQVAALKA
jgi:hypothetical protein